MDRARIARMLGSLSVACFGVAAVTFFLGMLVGAHVPLTLGRAILTTMYVGWGGGIVVGLAALVAWLATPRGERGSATIALAPIVVFALMLAGFTLLIWLIFSGLGNV